MIPRRLFWLLDLIVLAVGFLATYSFLPRLALSSGQLPPLGSLVWTLLVMAPATIFSLGAMGNHRPLFDQSRTRIIGGSFFAPLVSMSLVAFVLFALKGPDPSRLFSFSFTVVAGVSLCLYRLLLRENFIRRRATGHYSRNVLLIGLLSSVRWMEQFYTEQVSSADYRLFGYLDACSDQELPVQTPRRGKRKDASGVVLKSFGNVKELGNLLIRYPIHEVVAIHSVSESGWIKQVIRDCSYLGVLLRIVPAELLLCEPRKLYTLYPFEHLHLPSIVLPQPHFSSGELLVKRLIDVIISAILLVLLSPLFGLIAIAIKLTTRNLPILYPWHVIGQNGAEFTGYKFTTMVADADERKAELMSSNEMTGPVFKIKDDPRITLLGRFLRKYSLNELPQLWSVFKGDMSLVGPRPAFHYELERYEFWHKRRLSIRPGITCLWQVRGRNKISNFDDWVRMDLEYIDNWSLWLDLKILLRTVWVVIAGTGS